MFKRVMLILLSLWLSLPALAQSAERPPAIVRFESDAESVSLDAVEAGNATVTLRWHVVHVELGMSLTLEAYRLGAWENVLNEGEVLQAVGERVTEVRAPLNYSPPAFRLRLLATDGVTVRDSLLLTLSYTPLNAEQTPSIDTFVTQVQTLTATELQNGGARVPVTWSVSNRPPRSNLIFDQIINGSPVSVELPRQVYRVPSAGTGNTAPRIPGADEPVILRLTLLDTITGEVHDSAEIRIPVDGSFQPAPAATAAPQATPQPQPGATLDPGDTGTALRIANFSASTDAAAPGENLTLTWETEGAVTVTIREILSDQRFGQWYTEQPPSGSLDVTMPSNTDGITYQIVAESAAGGELAQQISVATVSNEPPVINNFIISTNTANVGDELTLSWDVSGASTIIIQALLPGNVLGERYEGLDANASLQVAAPDATGVIYLMFARASGGAEATAQVSVSIAPAPEETEQTQASDG